VTGVGDTTVIFTTDDVAESPDAVATAFKAYEPAFGRLPVTANGDVVACPNDVAPAKYSTFVTVPPVTEAVARRLTLAGAENTAPETGLVRVTVGGFAPPGAVERM
jgi:hypothetical protein